MTFYQELQLNQTGSKAVIRNSKSVKEKWRHIAVYLFKIMITMAFCFGFVTVYSLVFGNDNSIVGVVVLLCLMVFKNADFGIHTGQSTALLAGFFVIMAVGPHAANAAGPFVGMLINIVAIGALMLLGCHNPFMFNQSTLVLGYLLLYGYDVSGVVYRQRLIGLAVGAVLVCFVFYRNHVGREYKNGIKETLHAFRLESSRTRWQLCQIICVPLVVCIAEVCRMPRAMWAGIAAMSVILPFTEDMKARVGGRLIGNIAGVFIFLILYYVLPPSIYAYIGIIGGIGVGFSVKYGWQAVFNTFGALAIAANAYGLTGAMSLRVIQNVFGAVFALVFCIVLNWVISKVASAEKENSNGETIRL